jgi:hypothetical protein
MTSRLNRAAGLLAAAAMLACVAAPAGALEPRPGARLRALDKVTGSATDLTVRAGESVRFGRLNLTVKACYAAAPEDTPESAAFLEIRSLGPSPRSRAAIEAAARGEEQGDPNAPPIFSGWMYASSPGLNALEHPVYDVWVISCTGAPAALLPAAPVAPDGAAPAAPATPAPAPQQ